MVVTFFSTVSFPVTKGIFCSVLLCSVCMLKKTFMTEITKNSSLLRSLIHIESIPNAENKHNYRRSRCHTMSSSSLLLMQIFLVSLITFFTIMSILLLVVNYSVTGNKQPLLFGSGSSSTILPSHPVMNMMSKEEAEFWKEDGNNCKPCLCTNFSFQYRKVSVRVSKEKRKFLRVIVHISRDGDLYHLRNLVVDAVIFSRILGAALIIPVFKTESNSEFADIFDVEHFIKTLQTDVRVVASHPYTHLTSNQLKGFELPHHVTPQWLRTKFRKQLNDDGILTLNAMESTLSRKLPADLRKLRCKVAFHALQFSKPIREIGFRLARRLWIEGPYAAFDLGLNSASQDTGLVTGNTEHQIVTKAKNLKDLGVPRSATVYAAGVRGKHFGAAETLKPLKSEFPNMVSVETVARAGELSSFVNNSYAMAAIDYTVMINSDVLLVAEDTNLGQAMQDHRAYTGKKKVITRFRSELKTHNIDSRYASGCCMCKQGFKLF